MRCHYCQRDADVEVESDDVRVGLCEECFRDRLEELAEANPPAALDGAVDVE